MALGERGATGATGATGARGPKGDRGDSLSEWMEDHPGTILYIALMVTASVALQAYQAFIG
jgi:hypothetical protein